LYNNDILIADTSADKIHKNASFGGYGVPAERVAQTILFLEGKSREQRLVPHHVRPLERRRRRRFNDYAQCGKAPSDESGGRRSGLSVSHEPTPTSGPTFTSPLTISTLPSQSYYGSDHSVGNTASAPYIGISGASQAETTDAANGSTTPQRKTTPAIKHDGASGVRRNAIQSA